MIGWNEAHAKATPKAEWVQAHSHLGEKGFLETEHDKLTGAEPAQPVQAKRIRPSRAKNPKK